MVYGHQSNAKLEQRFPSFESERHSFAALAGPDADVLIELQYTAMEFMFRSEDTFKLGPNRNRGLLYSQQIWRQKKKIHWDHRLRKEQFKKRILNRMQAWLETDRG